ncbi:TonB-dependent receptor [Sphingomonas mali]|uniref:TonB-dependent receptor n=1 Tax=Sphingomonas mali TaxID=40682 RepID=UPI000AD0B209|nr:TonB-dependent receptor [Sphingomonas mali]
MRKLAILLATSAVLACGSAPAYAAEAEKDGKSDADQNAPAPNDIVITAPRDQEKAREVKKNALNIVEVQSAESIAKYPDFNAAEALSRVPGISLSSDTGEGRFVNIRGIDGNLNGATYGGVVLLNTNPGGTVFGSGRAVEFDTIPTGAIDGFIVTKTGMPNHDAEGLGGSIELTPRSAANVTHPFADGAIGYGYEPEHRHGGPLNLDLAVGGRFGGANKPFSIVLTGSWREDRRGFDDIEEDYVDEPGLTSAAGPAFSAGQVNKAVADYQLRRYDYHRRRFGYGGEFAYTPNENHQYYLRASVAGYVESVLKNRLTYDKLGEFDDNTKQADTLSIDPTNPAGYATTTAITIKGTDEEETHRNQVYVIGGKDRFGAFTLDYHAAYSKATFSVGRNYGTTFNGPKNVPFSYDNSNPDFPALAIVGGATDPNNASLYKLAKLSNTKEKADDHEWSYAANGALDTHWIGSNDRLQFGGQVRLRTKTDTPFNQSFTLAPTTAGALLGSAITDFYGDRYSNGPQIDEKGIEALAANSSPSAFTPDLGGYFRAREDIYAGYAMYTLDAGKLGGVVGVRVEHTKATYQSYSFDADGNLLSPDPVTRRRDYTNVFPTVQLRYSLDPTLVIRATYSTGIGRPGFSQVAAPITIDHDNEIITRGNPDLKPTTGNNFDLSIEKYLPHSGILSLGAFDKELRNYVAKRTAFGTDPVNFPGVTKVEFDTFENIPTAYARGVEAAYDQRFAFLPAPFDGIGVGANVTYVDSQVELRSGEKRQLPATSKWTWNAAVYYEAHGVQLRLSAQYVGTNLFGIGDTPALDVFQSPRTTLDFTSSIGLTRNVRVYFNAKNLTNEALRIYEGSPDRPIQREFYDGTFEGGIKFKF